MFKTFNFIFDVGVESVFVVVVFVVDDGSDAVVAPINSGWPAIKSSGSPVKTIESFLF